jgi:hypothetical protein
VQFLQKKYVTSAGWEKQKFLGYCPKSPTGSDTWAIEKETLNITIKKSMYSQGTLAIAALVIANCSTAARRAGAPDPPPFRTPGR